MFESQWSSVFFTCYVKGAFIKYVSRQLHNTFTLWLLDTNVHIERLRLLALITMWTEEKYLQKILWDTLAAKLSYKLGRVEETLQEETELNFKLYFKLLY